MKRKKLIMAPGPTNIPQNYLELMSEEFPHHRTQEFAVLIKKLRANLQQLLYMEHGEILLISSSGTGAMESTVANLFNAEDKVLVINIGFFGDRFTTMTTRYGLEVIELKYPMGETYDIADVQEVIESVPDLRGVFITHHETSTGVLNDLETLGEILKNYDDILYIVDSISGLIVHPFYMDKWHIDAVACASQKGFLMPPGLSFVGLSPAAIARSKETTLPRFYWDYVTMLEYLERGQTPSTPNIAMMQLMLHSTNDLLQNGLETVWKHHTSLRHYLEKQLSAIDIELGVTDEKIRGSVCVVAKLPEGVEASVVCDALEKQHDIVIVQGLGEGATGKIRIGIIGPLTENDVDLFIKAFKQVLADIYHIEYKK